MSTGACSVSMSTQSGPRVGEQLDHRGAARLAPQADELLPGRERPLERVGRQLHFDV
jgi:hypothetical protein